MAFTPLDENRPSKDGPLASSSTPRDRIRPKHLLDEIASHDAFVTLLEVIDTARNRKNDLLALIEDANTLMVNRLPFGDNSSSFVDLSHDTNEHVCWLRKNLAQTNQVLEVAIQHLRMLYGNAYLPSNKCVDCICTLISKLRISFRSHFACCFCCSYFHRKRESSGKHDISKLLLQVALEANNYDQSTVPNVWTERLSANSAEYGHRLAFSVQKYFEAQTVKVGDRINLMYDRFCAVGQLLCSASYVQSQAGFIGAADSFQAFTIATDKLTKHEFPDPAGAQLYSEVLDARQSAVNDLEDALDLLRSEIELSKLKQSSANN